jgi:predicted transcriptional regulator
MRHRSGIDIMGEILDAANEKGGVGKSRIMYKAFLSYAQLKEYLPALTESRLLRYDIDTQTFKTTQKGLRFLNTYNRIGEAMKIPSIRQQQFKMQGGWGGPWYASWALIINKSRTASSQQMNIGRSSSLQRPSYEEYQE